MKNRSINMEALLPQLKAQFLKLSGFSILFVFVKINAFTAALFLSNFVDNTADYGLFEYALSIGLIAAIPLNFGLQGAYPFFNLRLQKEGFKSVFYFHSLLVSSLLCLLFVINQWLFPFMPEKIAFALLIGGIIAMQVMLSAILKSHEVLSSAMLLDGGLFLVLNLYNLWLYVSGTSLDFALLAIAFSSYMLLLWGMHLLRFLNTRSDFSWSRYKEVLGFGKNLLLSSFLIICLTGSARIFIEYFLGMEQVGIYAFYFRFAAAVVMIHQVVNIVFFKKMYESSPAMLDKCFVVFLLFILLVGSILLFAVPLIFNGQLNLLDQTWRAYRELYVLLSFQMVFWICLALNENILYREQLSVKMNRWFLALLGLMTASIWLMARMDQLNVFNLTLINAICLALACEIQFMLLRKKQLPFTKTRILNIFFALLLLLTYVIM
ncbi:MAG: oligosaccharide flippase family protein [Saprospiraceae bacterium]